MSENLEIKASMAEKPEYNATSIAMAISYVSHTAKHFLQKEILEYNPQLVLKFWTEYNDTLIKLCKTVEKKSRILEQNFNTVNGIKNRDAFFNQKVQEVNDQVLKVEKMFPKYENQFLEICNKLNDTRNLSDALSDIKRKQILVEKAKGTNLEVLKNIPPEDLTSLNTQIQTVENFLYTSEQADSPSDIELENLLLKYKVLDAPVIISKAELSMNQKLPLTLEKIRSYYTKEEPIQQNNVPKLVR